MLERGIIKNREFAQQIKDFSGLQIGKITPTDIDGFIEYRDRLFIFIELKYGGFSLPYGQRLAYERLVDNLSKPAILFVCGHMTPPKEDIDVATLNVVAYYQLGKWVDDCCFNLRRGIDRYIERYSEND